MTEKMEGYHKEKSATKTVEEPVAAYLKVEQDPLRPETVGFARRGVSSSYLIAVAEHLGLSMQELADILHISVRTIQRWEADKILDVDLSSKAIHLARLEQHGVRVFGTCSAFGGWLRKPIPALQGFTPLSYLDTPFGFEIVHQLLGRIEHGIFA
jgi:putative toxin-antitoxin system antitoxin component (TIGR02293 family)